MDSSVYVAEGVSERDRITGLAASQRLGEESNLAASIFIASIDRKRWRPLVVVVRCGGAVVGVVYTKERKLLGLPTGLIHGDASRVPLVVCDPNEREAVWHCALNYLLMRRTVLGIRLEVPDAERHLYAEHEVLHQQGVVASYREYAVNSILDLSSSFEELLSRMGPHTRRNFRYYRRQSEAAENEYIDAIAASEFPTAVLELMGKSSIPAERRHVERKLAICLAADQPIFVGIRASGGKWLAILGGWFVRDSATVLFQMNGDRDHPKQSLSMVLRGYLIESLIRRGVRSVVFLGGASEPLRRYCHNNSIVILFIDKAKGIVSPARFLELAARLAPPSLASKVPWIFNPN